MTRDQKRELFNVVLALLKHENVQATYTDRNVQAAFTQETDSIMLTAKTKEKNVGFFFHKSEFYRLDWWHIKTELSKRTKSEQSYAAKRKIKNLKETFGTLLVEAARLKEASISERFKDFMDASDDVLSGRGCRIRLQADEEFVEVPGETTDGSKLFAIMKKTKI